MKKYKKILNYGSQYIDKDDIKIVSKSLKKKFLTSGPLVNKFENNLKNFFNVKNAHVCNSGTSAIFLALLSIGLSKGDKVILPSINFIAAANMVKFLGATPFFADVNPLTAQMETTDVKNCIKKNKVKKIKAIIVMYNGGYPRSIKEYWKLKKELKCYLIEDACHALGSDYLEKGIKQKIGSCMFSDIATFSLHPLKTITTCEGGIVTTNNKIISEKIKLYRSHGIIRKNKFWEYDVKHVGFNFRLNDVSCALGISQLKKIKKILSYRKKIHKIYIKNLNNFKNILTIIDEEKSTNSSFHLVIALIDFEFLKVSKDIFLKTLQKNNIFCQVHYIPNYKFKAFKGNHKLPGAEKYFKECISLPIHLNLRERDVYTIISVIKKIIESRLKKSKNFIN